MQMASLHAAAHPDDFHVGLKTKLLAALSKNNRKYELFDAIRCHKSDIFEYLIEKYHDLRNARDGDGFTPLLRLVEVDKLPEEFWKKGLNILLSHEVDMNASDHWQRWTPLLRAVNCQNVPLDLVERLVQKGASVHESREEDTPLMLAARNGRKDIVEFLIKSGARVDAQNRWKRTAADEARLKDYNDVADYLDELISKEKFVNAYRFAD
jgi:ankyrin repeat protein